MDVNNLQYYEPTPPQAPEPWWKQRRFLMTGGIILLTVGGLALLVVFLVNTVFLGKEGAKRAQEMDQVEAIANELAADCEQGDAECRVRAQADAARQVGVVEACKNLPEDRLPSCVTLIAIDHADAAVCGSLSGADRNDCEDAAKLKQAKNEGEEALCGEIHDGILRVSCEEQLAGNDAALEAAVATGNPNECEGLSVDEEATCRDILNDSDSDGDGLNDAEEFEEYHTDPHNADTDGDTFPDGTEVESGYDPLS